MKTKFHYVFPFIALLSIIVACVPSEQAPVEHDSTIVATDIPLFWSVYDQVIQTSDTNEQMRLMDELYLQKGSPGLHAMMAARRYTSKSYVQAINEYPNFWKSLRSKTNGVENYSEDIQKGIQQLKALYPDLKPAKIYFTMGALMSVGTTLSDKVLIGAEIAMADSTVITNELTGNHSHLPKYIRNNPYKKIVFNNVHEYVHTQQDTTIPNSLLSKVLIEGVPEFVAEKTLNIPSPNNSILFGKANDTAIKATFVKEMFTEFDIMWFWGNPNNKFNVGDLGYYVGYAICKSYYEQAADKKLAIKTMIELDYHNETEINQFIDDSKYFAKSMKSYREEFEKNRPKIVGISEFENGSQTVDPSIKTLTLQFSERMNTSIRNLRTGPMGENNLLTIIDLLEWSEDGKEITFAIELKPNLQQQLLVTDIFKSEEGYLLEPYLIDITTK